jgi:hypothetical protein
VASRTGVIPPIAKCAMEHPRFSSSANIGRPRCRDVVHRQGVT